MDNLWKNVQKIKEIYGKSTENIQKIWEISGKSMENMGNLWKIYGTYAKYIYIKMYWKYWVSVNRGTPNNMG